MSKRTRNLLLIVFTALLVLAVLNRGETYPPYSTYSPRPDGTKALTLLLEEEGVTAARLRTVVPDGQGLMFVQNDTFLSDQEWEQIFSWVKEGNTVLWTGYYSAYIFDYFGFKEQPGFGVADVHPVTSEHPLLADVQELTLGWGRLQRHASMSFAYGDDGGIFLSETTLGDGRIVLLSQPEMFTNRYIGRSDNLILFLNILRLYSGGGIWFNEYAHGFTMVDTDTAMVTWQLRLVLFQLLLGVLLLYYYWGKRFGRPVPLLVDNEVIAGEYVRSLANIYRQGKARHLVLNSINQGFRADLSRYLGVRKNLSDQELIAIFAERPWIDGDTLKTLLNRHASLINRDISEAELYAWARELALWQDKNLLRRPERRTIHGS
jgi:hypothetical protein